MKCAIPMKPATPADAPKDKERDQLILKHLGQVKILARRISNKIPASVEYADLVSAGILGLIEAIEKFDPMREIKFKTFAEYRIQGAMLDSLRNLDWAPRGLRVKHKKMQAVCGSLEQRLGRTATEEEKCSALGINLASYHRLTGSMAGMSMNSLETLMDTKDQRNLTLSKGIPDSPNTLPSALYEKYETSNIIGEAIAELPNRERLIISLYYYEQASMAMIGKILGVNESRISQVHASAMRRLKIRLRSMNVAA